MEEEQRTQQVEFRLVVDNRETLVDLSFKVPETADLTDLARMVFDWFSKNQK